MRHNKLRQLLNDGKPTICARTSTVWPDIVEVIGHLGTYDYVEFASEYGPFSMADLDNYCRAAEIYDLGTMIKVDQDPRTFLAQRAIGSGFQSVLFVDCRTVADVQACVAAVRPDTPDDGGLYGATPRRFAYSGDPKPEYVQALRDIVIAIMVEKHVLVENLEEILSVPGIDMIQWGPSDYTMSSGAYRPGKAVDIAAVERKVIETSLKMGVAPRVELKNLDEAPHYWEMGVRHFRLGDDMAILRNYWRQNGEGLRKLVSQ